jgi:5-(carboxyamino)imidazole ribonucleotide synthase
MKRLEASGVRVTPQAAHVELIQDKALQKEFFEARGIPTAPFKRCEGGADGLAMAFPFVHKIRRGGCDV